jgi:hypothetical protein
VYSGGMGVIYDSQATNRSVPEGVGVLARNPPCFLLVIWESDMNPTRMAMHFFIAIQIRVKGSWENIIKNYHWKGLLSN